MKKKKQPLPLIGWREWLALPDLAVDRIKAKIDTGARSSALHVVDIQRFKRRGRSMIRFAIHPQQRSAKTTIKAEAELFEYRRIRSSNGQTALRPVIVTDVNLMGRIWPIELTLTNRDEMGFRMLLGREAVRDRFLIDCGHSYFGERFRAQSGEAV